MSLGFRRRDGRFGLSAGAHNILSFIELSPLRHGWALLGHPAGCSDRVGWKREQPILCSAHGLGELALEGTQDPRSRRWIRISTGCLCRTVSRRTISIVSWRDSTSTSGRRSWRRLPPRCVSIRCVSLQRSLAKAKQQSRREPDGIDQLRGQGARPDKSLAIVD
jgi:hypothetical protein